MTCGCTDTYTYMYRHAKIIQLELVSHFTEWLKAIFTLGLLKSVHFCRFMTLLGATDNTDITRALWTDAFAIWQLNKLFKHTIQCCITIEINIATLMFPTYHKNTTNAHNILFKWPTFWGYSSLVSLKTKLQLYTSPTRSNMIQASGGGPGVTCKLSSDYGSGPVNVESLRPSASHA